MTTTMIQATVAMATDTWGHGYATVTLQNRLAETTDRREAQMIRLALAHLSRVKV